MGHKIRAIQRGAKGLLQCYSKTPTKIWMTYMFIIYHVQLFIKYEINNRKIMLANIYIWIQHTHTQKVRSFFRILSHKPNVVNWTENPVTKWSTTTSFLFSGPSRYAFVRVMSKKAFRSYWQTFHIKFIIAGI